MMCQQVQRLLAIAPRERSEAEPFMTLMQLAHETVYGRMVSFLVV